MTGQTSLVPKRRFKAFQNTHAWEQRKLGEVCCIGDIDHRMPPSVLVGIPYVMTGDFIENNAIDFENAKCISEEDYEQLSRKIKPEKGDILFARYASVGTVRYIEDNRKFLISYSCVILKHTEDIEGKYLYCYLQTDVAQQQIELEINTGSQRNIGIDSLKNNIVVSVPKIDEQIQIIDFFTNLDHLITLHQRKLEKMKALKSAYLSEMFPAEGESEPKRRFAGFTDAWEQRKVIDIAPLQRGFDLPVSEMEAGSYPVIMSNGIGAYHSKYKAKAPGVVTGRSGTIGNLTFVEADYWPHNTALWVTDFKGNDAKFIYYLYQKLDLKRYGTGSGVPTLNRNDVHDTIASIPSVAEQKQISRLFDHLDHLITLHQRKLEKLQNIKKAYLNEMFV